MQKLFVFLIALVGLITGSAKADDAWFQRKISCEGDYAHHVQGVCLDDAEGIYWCFTTELVKTDRQGKLLKKVPVANHHGDLCFHDGKIYVAVNLGQFNQPAGAANSWVYVYDAESLEEVARHEVQEVVHGAGGIACREGRFIVVGGLPGNIEENFLYEYDESFRFQKRHVLASGQTLMGIQTAAYQDGCWLFGCYGRPEFLLKADDSFQYLGKQEFSCSLGIVPLGEGKFLIARGKRENNRETSWLVPAVMNSDGNLELLPL